MKKADEHFEFLAHQAINLRYDIAGLCKELAAVESNLNQYYEPGQSGCIPTDCVTVQRVVVQVWKIMPDSVDTVRRLIGDQAFIELFDLNQGYCLTQKGIQVFSSADSPLAQMLRPHLVASPVRLYSYHQTKPFFAMPKELDRV